MKILSLQFKNLNSLYGEWKIDFSGSEIASEGIFAITGPTGAGKTTIMDAICLALYGLTPRLGKITASGNELMSRNTGECFAEVTFSTQSGKYRCRWSQHRAYKKADGRLRDADHEIAEADTGKLLETKKSLVANVVQSKTGMDFDQFTRSMMLAQGSFARFLQSEADERAPILEQITGTDIYCEISKKVHERFREEENKLNDLKKSSEGIEILSPEQQNELEQELKKLQKQEHETTQLYRQIEKKLKWCTDIATLKKEIVELDAESDKIKIRFDEFKPNKEKLDLAIKASELETDYKLLTSLQQQQKNDCKKLEDEKSKLEKSENKKSEIEQSRKVSEEKLQKVRSEYKEQEPVIKQVRQLDLKIKDKNELLQNVQKRIDKNSKLIKNKEKEIKSCQADIKKVNKKIEKIAGELDANKADQELVGEFSAIKDLLSNLENLEKEVEQHKKEIEKCEKQKARSEKDWQKASKELASAAEKSDKQKKKLEDKNLEIKKLLGDKLLREYRAQRDSMLRERAYIKQIQDLEEMRKNLVDDKACPLCGSLDHPFARGNVPQIDETDAKIKDLEKLIKKAEKLESEIEAAEKEYNELNNALNKQEKHKTKAEYQLKICNQDLLNAQQQLKDKDEKLQKNRVAAQAKLKQVAVSELPENNFSEFIKGLEKRKNKWLTNISEKEKIEKEKSELDSALKSFTEVLSTLQQSQQDEEKAKEISVKEYNDLSERRKYLYEDKDPDKEQNKLETEIEKAQKDFEAVNKDLNELNQQIAAISSAIKNLKSETEHRALTLKESEASFAEKLIQHGFVDRESFIQARLDAGERNKLSDQYKEIETLKTQILVRKKDREQRLKALLEQDLTQDKVDKLESEYERLQTELQTVSRSAGAVKQKLDDNKAAIKKFEAKAGLIENQQKELECWGKLHKLIGSADGKKYRMFAQSLTFEILVYNANQQLKKLSERYLLVQNEDEPLELCVIDNYQAGERRSTRNLSGGESFIVSLALALGLSQMSSKKVRVDSLFLDEGFGTLDEDSLESALATLANLHQEGKLIGVISHVTVLKDRIGMQIEVIPEEGGRSKLTGPGCQKIQ